MQPVSDGGGSEHALIRMIRQLRADGWECHVAVPGPARLASEYAEAGATLHLVPMERLTTSGGTRRWARYAHRWPLSVWELVRLCRRLDVGVVHTNSLHSWYGWAAARLTGRPHVWHAREIVFQSSAALRIEQFLTSHFADRVIAVSAAVASQLDPARTVVVTDEADPAQFSPDRAGRFRRSAGIAEDVPLVGSVARIDTWKGFDALLDAFPLMRASRPDLELVVAGAPVLGKEAYAAALERRAAGIAGVHWLGMRRDVADIMADLDAFVQVSTGPEPFGLVVVEALASGVPVVAGAQGGPLEILGAKAATCATPAGRLVEPGDAGSLAAAVISVLPPGRSSPARRRSRPRLRSVTSGQFSELFGSVLAEQPVRRRRPAQPQEPSISS